MSSATPALLQRTSDRSFYVFNAVLSTAALAFLAYLLLIRGGTSGTGLDLRFMPAVNACLNALSATLLVGGWVAVKRGNRQLHKYLMVSAFAASALFLVGYIAYHSVHGDTQFAGEGAALRGFYFAVLISHILLSMAVLPLALTSFFFAARGQFARHKKVTRWALPIWLYVSVTGVVIFFMLRGSAPVVS
jgi:putative membrane protein